MAKFYTLVSAPKSDRCEPLMASLVDMFTIGDEISREELIDEIDAAKVDAIGETDKGETVWRFGSSQDSGKILTILIARLFFGNFVDVRDDGKGGGAGGAKKTELDRQLESQKEMLAMIPDMASNKALVETIQGKIDDLEARIAEREVKRAEKADA